MKLLHLTEESTNWLSDFGEQFGSVEKPIWCDAAIPVEDSTLNKL